MKKIVMKKNLFSLSYVVRNTVYFFAGLADRLFPDKSPKLTIYCYHSISDDGWRFSVTKEAFQKQMDYLLKHAVPLRLSEVPKYITGEKKLRKNSFVITFDDGYSNILEVKDILKERGIRPTAFVLSDEKNIDHKELDTPVRKFLSKSEMKELLAHGWEIGSHGATHADFGNLDKEALIKEVRLSMHDIQDQTGIPVNYFAYPKGVYTPEVVEEVYRSGYHMACSMDDGYIQKGSYPFTLPRVGVDGTHSMAQFKYLASPMSIYIRGMVKKYL